MRICGLMLTTGRRGRGGGRVPLRSLRLFTPFPAEAADRAPPTLMSLPKGDALQRQGVKAPQLLLFSPSLGQLSVGSLSDSLPRLTRMFHYSYFDQIV